MPRRLVDIVRQGKGNFGKSYQPAGQAGSGGKDDPGSGEDYRNTTLGKRRRARRPETERSRLDDRGEESCCGLAVR